MKPIVTLTLNPTIDGSASAEKIVPLHKIRTSDERYHAGGGGINVARVIGELGGRSHALYLAGGATGTILEDLLRHGNIAAQAIPISGYTRIAHSVLERASGQEYRFVPEGPEVSASEWDACLAALAAPPVAAKSAVGAGDSFVGALALAVAQGRPLSEAFLLGVAAGTAAVLSPGGGLCLAGDVTRLVKSLAAVEVG